MILNFKSVPGNLVSWCSDNQHLGSTAGSQGLEQERVNNKRLSSVTDCILCSKVMNNNGDLESGERHMEKGILSWGWKDSQDVIVEKGNIL